MTKIGSNYSVNKILNRFDTVTNLDMKFKPLIFRLTTIAGRSYGHIITPRRSNYYKRLYRAIDFKRIVSPNSFGFVVRFEYDPNRSANVSLICISRGVYLYILKPARLAVGDVVMNKSLSPVNIGDSGKLLHFSSGILIHNLSLYPNRKGQVARSAGCSTILIRHENGFCILKLKSGEIRYLTNKASASLGVVGHEIHFLRHYKRAGVIRRFGRRPRTRPSAMNPVDHPMGGRTRGGCQPMTRKGSVSHNKPSVRKHSPNVLYTRRQMKFRRY